MALKVLYSWGGRRFFWLGLALILAAGCSGWAKYQKIMPWQVEEDEYTAVLEEWSDRAEIIRGLESMLQVAATYKSKAFRRAYVEKYSRDYRLAPQAAEKMLADEMAGAEENWEFLAAVAAPSDKKNDLAAQDSAWKIYLETGDGRRMEPFEIRPVKKKTAQLEAFYPYVTPWTRVYQIRFRPGNHVLTSERINLILTGVLGSARLSFKLED